MIHAYDLSTRGTVFNQPDWDNWRCNYNYTTVQVEQPEHAYFEISWF